jgi:hypothetical protein
MLFFKQIPDSISVSKSNPLPVHFHPNTNWFNNEFQNLKDYVQSLGLLDLVEHLPGEETLVFGRIKSSRSMATSTMYQSL